MSCYVLSMGQKTIRSDVQIHSSSHSFFGMPAPSQQARRGELHVPFATEALAGSASMRRSLLPFIVEPVEIPAARACWQRGACSISLRWNIPIRDHVGVTHPVAHECQQLGAANE